MAIKFTNNASATLASSISNTATSITLTTGQGALFPTLSGSDYFYATLINSSNVLEIIKVTARSGDTLTVVRGQEGTTASAYSAGDKLENRVTAAGLGVFVQPDYTGTMSGAITFSNTTALSGGGSLAGTFSGAPIFSGNVSFTGTPNFTNSFAIGTLSAWGSGKAFQLGGPSSLWSDGGTTNATTAINTNAYWNGTGWAYINTATAVQYYQTTQTHYWRTAVSGTAGTSVSAWVQQMSLDSAGNLVAAANVTAYSDERVKTNWRDLPNDFIERIAKIKFGIYDRTDIKQTQVGVSAQSLQEVLPEAVMTDEHGQLSVAYGNAALVAVIELAKRIIALESSK